MAKRGLIQTLQNELKYKINGGIYHKLQVDFAYNSNHIEGSRLSHEQTQYIYDTQTTGIEPARIDDIFEAVNHFRCFDRIIREWDRPLTGDFIKSLHRQLKTGTYSSQAPEAVIGDYKRLPNTVGGMETTSPKQVQPEMRKLLEWYHSKECPTLDDLCGLPAGHVVCQPLRGTGGRRALWKLYGCAGMHRPCLFTEFLSAGCL